MQHFKVIQMAVLMNKSLSIMVITISGEILSYLNKAVIRGRIKNILVYRALITSQHSFF